MAQQRVRPKQAWLGLFSCRRLVRGFLRRGGARKQPPRERGKCSSDFSRAAGGGGVINPPPPLLVPCLARVRPLTRRRRAHQPSRAALKLESQRAAPETPPSLPPSAGSLAAPLPTAAALLPRSSALDWRSIRRWIDLVSDPSHVF
ncbi:hypothetical protein PVAP13_9KG649450 [Panicum virgatum]|uniref:Uncharacterized protein n=1 Tax=Panicum virgatum TaxID=38727 RepID=A0A8T0P200_PANVG|nr:hypothetical protein PVAP13_9KG649450 [Panicum virgatum]